MSEKLIETVLQILGEEESEILLLKIDAYLNQILSYLNRTEIDETMFSIVCLVIADCINSEEKYGSNIQSLSEGDLSISYFTDSPFFGKLESFKLVKGIN